jgi:carbohydrate-selective porin OprB
MERTKVRLAKDLKDHNAPEWMIKNAIDGYYDDYETDIATPILQLVIDCEKVGLKDIAGKARNGYYDSTKEEADKWMSGKAGREALSELGSFKDILFPGK